MHTVPHPPPHATRNTQHATRNTPTEPRIPLHVARVCVTLGLVLLAIGLPLGGCLGLSPQVEVDKPTPTLVETPLPTETPGPSPTADAPRPDDILYIRRRFESLSGDVWLVHSDHASPRQVTALTLEQVGAHSDYPVWRPDHQAFAFASDFRDAYNLAAWNVFVGDAAGAGVEQRTSLPLPLGTYFPRPVQLVPGIRTWLNTPLPGPGTPTPPANGRITGRVLQDGAPVEGATITSGGVLTYTLTGADGRYSLDGLPPGTTWVKAAALAGANWITGTLEPGGTWQVPDLVLDIKKSTIENTRPGWDRDGQGLWLVETARWLDKAGTEPRFEPRLLHIGADGIPMPVYSPQNGSLGPPRVNPAQPNQVAISDGPELLLLTGGKRRVLVSGVLRDSALSWSPDGATLYYLVAQGAEKVELRAVILATGTSRPITSFKPNYQTEAGFDTSPDGRQVVYEQLGDLYIYDLDQPLAPAPTRTPFHITYFGGGTRPSWSGR